MKLAGPSMGWAWHMTHGGDDLLAALRDPVSPQAEHLAHTDLLLLQAGVDQFVDNNATDDLWAALVALAPTQAQAQTQTQAHAPAPALAQARLHIYSESYHEVLFEAADIRETAVATARAFLRDPACPGCVSTNLTRGGLTGLTVRTHTATATSAANTAAAAAATGLRGISLGSWRDILLAVRVLFLVVLVTYAASFAAAAGASGANARGKRKGKDVGTDKRVKMISSLADVLMALPFLGGSGNGNGSDSGQTAQSSSFGSTGSGASTARHTAVPATPLSRTTSTSTSVGSAAPESPVPPPLQLPLRIRADAPPDAGGATSPRRSPRLRR